jgi:hypothetical protein
LIIADFNVLLSLSAIIREKSPFYKPSLHFYLALDPLFMITDFLKLWRCLPLIFLKKTISIIHLINLPGIKKKAKADRTDAGILKTVLHLNRQPAAAKIDTN